MPDGGVAEGSATRANTIALRIGTVGSTGTCGATFIGNGVAYT